jgi:hypothetical protein
MQVGVVCSTQGLTCCVDAGGVGIAGCACATASKGHLIGPPVKTDELDAMLVLVT